MQSLAVSRKFPARRAFITGAGSGLGAAFARLLAADGWTLAINDLREEAVRETAAEVTRLGGKAFVYPFDVTDCAAFQAAAEQFRVAAGGVDLVINNAGVAVRGEIGECPLEDWDWIMDINVGGVLHGCHVFAPVLKGQKSGHFLNVASAAAFVPVPKQGAYCVSKAAVKMLSEVLYCEMSPHGVGVSMLMPEYFQTDIIERMRGPEKEQARYLIKSVHYTAEQVARRALDGAARNQLHIVFGLEANLVWRVIRWFPRVGIEIVRVYIRRLEASVYRKMGTEPPAP